MYLAGIVFNGNRSCVGNISADKFYRSKDVPLDQGKGNIVMATLQFEIKTEAFQVNLETKTLIIPRLGLKHTLEKTDKFTMMTSQGTIT